MAAIKALFNSFVFWGAWIIIPVLAEILPAMGSVLLLLRRRFKTRSGVRKPAIYPEITVIIPVYNSSGTLYECLRSLYESTYPTESIHVFLVNNESKDDSFSVFAECQEKFPSLRMQWLNAAQGKSRALNLALYNSEGKYVINMDSDGLLEPNALTNLVDKFEAAPDLNCMTGVILTMPDKIREYKGFFPRLMRNMEFMEYAQAFLAGRSYASELNAVYTLSGAFSAFRKSAILKSRLYSTDTLCEDTELTFQMKYIQNERVEVCENAIFFTEPIEDLNKLYTQRQRWQRGSLEVAKMFPKRGKGFGNPLADVNLKTLLYDHTFAFPRLIWYLALLCMMYLNYSGRAVLISTGIIFALYILAGYLYFIFVLVSLKPTPDIRKYYLSHWWVVALLPLFNMGVFFIRIAGIINSINTDSSWKTRNLTQEWESFLATLKDVLKKPVEACRSLRSVLDRPEEDVPGAPAPPSAGWYVIQGLLLFLGAALLCSVYWVSKTYGIGLNELLSTLTGNLQGTSTDVVIAVVKGCVLPAAAVLGAYVLLAALDRRHCRKKGKGRSAFSKAIPKVCAVLLACSVLYANVKFDALGYYITQHASSGIYEEYYVDPKSVAITPGEKKNLICIYLESMETTYASASEGGRQGVNYIPELTRLAKDNVSFSNTELLGGHHTVTGAGYTMAALFATTTGVPYALPVESTAITETGSFASGITGLGDVLKEQGYNQEFLCGSDAAFGGRELYFRQHGDYAIFDLFTAREQGYVPEDYYVWWGFEDSHLFEIAKDEATRLSKEDEPFNLTMLTVDLHHIAGYVCDQCGSEYSGVTEKVAACTDRQTAEFVEWCRQQPFYEDTVIVIMGDHPRMDTNLVDGVSYYDRTVYNCILNSAASPARTTNREFTHMDMFPTVLSAMGFQIEGGRLGLGTDLFSGQLTLAESLGFDYINTEVSKSSAYYVDTFAPELSGTAGTGTGSVPSDGN